jgi:hypothetical protein
MGRMGRIISGSVLSIDETTKVFLYRVHAAHVRAHVGDVASVKAAWRRCTSRDAAARQGPDVRAR